MIKGRETTPERIDTLMKRVDADGMELRWKCMFVPTVVNKQQEVEKSVLRSSWH